MTFHSQVQQPIYSERHYSVLEIAELWNLSPDTVRDLFQFETGVIAIGDPCPNQKRRYITLRIPHSVVERVHSRLSSQKVLR
jgi:hypothetical protein